MQNFLQKVMEKKPIWKPSKETHPLRLNRIMTSCQNTFMYLYDLWLNKLDLVVHRHIFYVFIVNFLDEPFFRTFFQIYIYTYVLSLYLISIHINIDGYLYIMWIIKIIKSKTEQQRNKQKKIHHLRYLWIKYSQH